MAQVLVSLISLAALVSQSAVEPAGLRERVLMLVKASGAEVAVAFRTLDGRHELLMDPDKVFHAASTMKLPVLIELFRQAEAGTLSLSEPLPIRNEFHSIVDGSVYQLDAGADSDRDVYKAIGGTLTLRQLAEAMITVSSNFAANLLIERLGIQNIRATVHRLGADGMQVLRGVEDGKAFEKGMNNTTSARGLLVLLETLARKNAVSPNADTEMLAILSRQTFKDAIPAGVPAGTRIAHKDGNITKIHHDAAIVYGPHPYVLVVLVRGLEEQKDSAALIAAISRDVWDAAR